MSTINVAINGFGRIGRLFLRKLLEKKDTNLNIVAINDLGDINSLAHLLKYDTIHGKLNSNIKFTEKEITVNSKSFFVYHESNPADLPWQDLNIDIVLECTGKFLTVDKAGLHLLAGAKKVITSAPIKDDGAPTIVYGVNENTLTKNDRIVSNASCTTNCLAPIVKIINDKFGIKNGFINTVHAVTADQCLHDRPHRDLRRSRAAFSSIIPTTTGAAKAIGKVIPELHGKIDGIAMRVPVINGSVIDITLSLKQNNLSIDDINTCIEIAARNTYSNIIEFNKDPLVSADIVGSNYSCIFDSNLTDINSDLVKIITWYDNESGYSSRLVDLCEYISFLI